MSVNDLKASYLDVLDEVGSRSIPKKLFSDGF